MTYCARLMGIACCKPSALFLAERLFTKLLAQQIWQRNRGQFPNEMTLPIAVTSKFSERFRSGASSLQFRIARAIWVMML